MSGDDARRADAEARLLAQTHFDAPLVVEAGAGTGKTAVLVARVVAWCVGPGWERGNGPQADAGDEAIAARVLRGVVAITFTEAAAAEMASRTGEFLLALERGELPVGLCPEALEEDPTTVAARASALLGVLDQLRVQSIHAFCRSLLARHPVEAGLHPRFEIDADGAARQSVAREVLEGLLAERFAERVDPDLLALAEAGSGPADVEAVLVDLLAEGVPPGFLDAEPLAGEAIASLLLRVRAAVAELLGAEEGRLLAAGGVAAEVSEQAATLASTLDGLVANRAGLDALIERAGAWPANGMTKLRAWERGEFGVREAAALEHRCAAVGAAAGRLLALLGHTAVLDPPLLERAIRVLRPLLAEAHERLRRRGAVCFDTLLRASRDLLHGSDAVAAAERGRIEQLLVDEFQDTDCLQCEVVAALGLRGPEAERPGLFVVGDPKQSIYGWRNADLRAYDRFLREELPAAKRVRLAVNYRSGGALLDEVERVIAPVMVEQRGVQPRFEPLLPHIPSEVASAVPTVEYWASWPWSEEGEEPDFRARGGEATGLEARAVAADIARRRAEGRAAFREVALLLRSLGDLDRYLEALREAGVPYVVDSDRSYYRRREVIDAAALVRCILDPHDVVALVSFLRSPWVGVPDAAWIPLFARRLPGACFELFGWDERARQRVEGMLEEAAKAVPAGVPGLDELAGWERSLQDAMEMLARLRESFAQDAADRFVETLRAGVLPEASAAARYLGAHRVASLERFFRELLSSLEDGADVSQVLRGLRQAVASEADPFAGPPRDPGEDAVRVMSIHKAKGLDFEEVYLLQHHKGTRVESDGAGLVLPSDLRDRELAVFGTRTLGFDGVVAARREREAAELVRTLYVAMTRARRRLVVAGMWARSAPGGRVATTHQQLLARRFPAVELAGRMTELAAAGSAAWYMDEGDLRFAFPALAPAFEGAAGARRAAPHATATRRELAHASRSLAALRSKAAERSARRLSRPASGDAAEAREELAEHRFGAEGEAPVRLPGRRRDVATAVGSAVHRALEVLDPAGLPLLERPRCVEAIHASLGASLPAAQREEAIGQALALLDGFFSGRLYARLRAVAPVARELPLLLREEGVPGFAVGAADLVYRDPADGAWAVADWKTDPVEAAGLREKADAYGPQLGVYLRAVQQALALEALPRGELWFLAADRIVSLRAPG